MMPQAQEVTCRWASAFPSTARSVAVAALVQAAAAKNAVPVTLELGGKSPQIAFADAELDDALPFLVNAGIQNAGQSCSAASRILVERRVVEAVLARMAERYRALHVALALDDRDAPVVVSNCPFGSVKHAGHGREKGFEALYGFSMLKTVAIRHG